MQVLTVEVPVQAGGKRPIARARKAANDAGWIICDVVGRTELGSGRDSRVRYDFAVERRDAR